MRSVLNFIKSESIDRSQSPEEAAVNNTPNKVLIVQRLDVNKFLNSSRRPYMRAKAQ